MLPRVRSVRGVEETNVPGDCVKPSMVRQGLRVTVAGLRELPRVDGGLARGPLLVQEEQGKGRRLVLGVEAERALQAVAVTAAG